MLGSPYSICCISRSHSFLLGESPSVSVTFDPKFLATTISCLQLWSLDDFHDLFEAAHTVSLNLSHNGGFWLLLSPQLHSFFLWPAVASMFESKVLCVRRLKASFSLTASPTCGATGCWL